MDVWVGFGLGGLCGGLLKNYFENDRTLVWPARLAGKGFAPGLLGDAAAGLIAGIVTAGVAPLLLNDHFVTAMGLGPKPPEGAAPLVVVALAVGAALGFGWRKVLPRVSDGVASLISSEVEKKTKDLSQKMDKIDEGTQLGGEEVSAVVATLTRTIMELRKGVTPGGPPPSHVPARPASLAAAAPAASVSVGPDPGSLQGLVDEYENRTQIADPVERLARKEQLASQMAAHALAHDIERPSLVSDCKRTRQEGYVLALASLVLVDPRPEDAANLLAVSQNLQRLHVRYRVVTAFGVLADRRFLDADQRRAARTRIEEFRAKADAALLRRIDATLRKLG